MKDPLPALPWDGRPLLVCLDFDGTLVPLAPTPDAVVVPDGLPQMLDRICAQGHLVRVVTGRAAQEVERRVPGVQVIGLHGLQWPGEPLPPRHPALDLAFEQAEAMRHRFPGMLLEDKGISLAMHYRQVSPDQRAAARSACLDLATQIASEAATLSVLPGHALIEIRPRAASKGRAILRLCQAFSAYQPLYVGDDQTDEEAFAALPPDGIGVRVGPPELPTRAHARLPDLEGVYALLAKLGEPRGELRPQHR